MATTDATLPPTDPIPAVERQATARRAYLDSVANGSPISGAELGRRFGRSPRWGLDRIAEVKAGGNPAADPHADEVPISSNGGGSAADQHADDVGPAAAFHRPHAVGMPTRPWMDTTVTLVVAVVAALASYGHMYDVALMAGEPLWIARAWPVTVDGLAYAALRRGEVGRWWLRLALLVSVASNVLAQHPGLVAYIGPAVSAWPPLALYGTHRLLRHRPLRAGKVVVE